MTLALDPEIAAVLAAAVAAQGPPTVFPPGDWRGIRQMMNGIMQQIHDQQPAHSLVVRRDAALADGVRMRWYEPPGAVVGPAVLYCHGGGMIGGSLELYDRLVAGYAALSGVRFLSVDYRLAPENPHPVPVGDCFAALLWLRQQAPNFGIDPARIAVMGDSAGGGLAAGVAILARDHAVALARQILIYPMLDDRTVTPDPALLPFVGWTYDNNVTGWQALLGESVPARAPDAAAVPARAASLVGLAPAYLDVGTLDIFCDEDVAYARRLMAAHVPVELHVHEGVPHAFEVIAPEAEVSRRVMADRVRVLRRL